MPFKNLGIAVGGWWLCVLSVAQAQPAAEAEPARTVSPPSPAPTSLPENDANRAADSAQFEDAAELESLPENDANQAADSAELEGPSTAPIQVRVRRLNTAEQAREQAEPVLAVDLQERRQESADLGQVLSETQGVSLQRSGGLGASARISLAGLQGAQVPIFVDGVPLEQAGFPFGIQNVPLQFLEQVEVYRGMVPIRLGAAALGGAINLLAEQRFRGPTLRLSYQGGSFDTHRLSGAGQYLHRKSGWFVRGRAFGDSTRNDYLVRVDTSGIMSANTRADVHRNNDDYLAGAVSLETGVVARSWAKRLSLRVSHGRLRKGIPHSLTMAAAYGAVNTRRSSSSAVLRYESPKVHDASFQLLLTYSRRHIAFQDVSTCAYDWYGRCVFDRVYTRGEIDGPVDQRVLQRGGLARVGLAYAPSPLLQLDLVSTLSLTGRSGEDYVLTAANLVDPLAGKRLMRSAVTGLQHTLDAFNDRLRNTLVIKSYAQGTTSESLSNTREFVDVGRSVHRFGVGDSLRYRLTPTWTLKGNYEWATRLPAPDELFGDGGLIQENLTLTPENSHNLNASLIAKASHPTLGALLVDLSGYVRLSEHMIVLIPGVGESAYQNVAGVRTVGGEFNVDWHSPEQNFALGGNLTLQDTRNTSGYGIYAPYKGDPIPNRPFFFGNAYATASARDWWFPNSTVSATWRSNYMHAFELGWASLSDRSQRVPSRLLHSLSLSLRLRHKRQTLISGIELRNITDARIYDFFGVQLPGRAIFATLTLEV